MTSPKTVIQKRWVLPILMLGLFCAAVSNAASIYVGDWADPYQKIQDAIDAANNGDTIIVRSGTYTENLTINKYLTLRSQNGASQTIVQPSGGSNVLAVSANGVTIRGFTIRNGTRGISLVSCANCQIQNSTCNGNTNANYAGILLHDQSYQNMVSGNTVTANGIGIAVLSGSNTISDNQLDQNYWYAVKVASDGNAITNNTVTNGTESGIFLQHALNNTIGGNTAQGNDEGIFLDSSSNGNTVSGNDLIGNSNAGVMISASASNIIQANTIESNTNFGINVDQANGNTITANTIRSNGLCGVKLVSSGDNAVYNNVLHNNASNGCDDTGGNFWAVAAQPGGNIIGGPYLGGNSWSDYPGRDLDGDGLGDTDLPHTSSGNILYGGDPHPLVPVGSNTPPTVPETPLPVDGAVYQNTAPRLTWSGGDPDSGDMVAYVLQLGKTFPLSQAAADLSDTEFDPGVLDDGDTYFWRVIATDSLSLSTMGPVWRFTVDSSAFGSYLFEEDSDTLADASGGDQTGTVVGAEFASGQGVAASSAFRFSWSNSDYVQIPYDAAQSAVEALTVEAWIYPTAWDNTFAGHNRIVSKQPVYLLRGVNGRAHFQILTESYGYVGIFDAQVMLLNTWHHVVGTFDGQEIRLYVDGRLRNSSLLPSPDLIVDNEADICIGEYPNLAEGFTGLIDNVTLLKRAKTQTEIQETYVNLVRPCEGDLDNNRHVDGSDLAILSDEYRRNDCLARGDCLGDTNADGTVDALDLSAFADGFGRENCWY